MPLSTSYYNSEVIRLKEKDARLILSMIYEKGDRVNTNNDFSWDGRKQAQKKVREMTNRQVFNELKTLGYQFNNERARWLLAYPANRLPGFGQARGVDSERSK